MSGGSSRLSAISKLTLAARIWYWYAAVRIGLRRWPLPRLVERLAGAPGAKQLPPEARLEPRRLGRIVHRALRLGPIRTRCLFSSLVFFRLLRQQGAEPELVIGLPPQAESHEAHAWVEIDRVVVGPPPGQLGHVVLARFSGTAPPGAGREDGGEAAAEPQSVSDRDSSQTSPQSASSST